ncbi:hypothetical protein K525DRAFT_286194 [Schizophyllum commune Loenen D]|nr:hypothetical protein K525DRAFT_286194 [Schizophyllum commune Loenen D]
MIFEAHICASSARHVDLRPSERTGFHGAMYADPDRKVFRALGMNVETLDRTPAGQEPKKYLPQGNIRSSDVDMQQAFKNPSLLGKQGKISQLGGEFVLGPGNVCTFASRMKHTEDRA